MRLFSDLIPVAAGGALGASCRFLLGLLASKVTPHFPLGTLLANGMGSFVAGILLGLALLNTSPSHTARLFLMTGFLGAFTTFSAFSFETLEFWLGQQRDVALGNIAANLSLALLACSAGYWVVQRLHA